MCDQRLKLAIITNPGQVFIKMITLVRTNSDNKDFILLVKQLDEYLAELDGEEHAFYNQLNKINTLHHVVVAYEADKPVGCGAIREDRKSTRLNSSHSQISYAVFCLK